MEIIILLFTILIIIILFVGLSAFLQRSAIIAVLKIFRKNNVLEVKNAKTREELGIMPKTFFGSMFKRRDYKPQALEFLLSAHVVNETEDHRLYLSEENFTSIRGKSSKIGKFFLPS